MVGRKDVELKSFLLLRFLLPDLWFDGLTTSDTPENLSNITARYPPGTSYREA